jgi:hypothetical protein
MGFGSDFDVLARRFQGHIVICAPKIHSLVHFWDSSCLPFPAEESYM